MGKNNDLGALRNHLFEVIERLKISNDPDADEKEKISVETAKAVTQAASIIVNSAKIEVEFLKIVATGDNPAELKKAASGTQFFLTEGK